MNHCNSTRHKFLDFCPVCLNYSEPASDGTRVSALWVNLPPKPPSVNPTTYLLENWQFERHCVKQRFGETTDFEVKTGPQGPVQWPSG